MHIDGIHPARYHDPWQIELGQGDLPETQGPKGNHRHLSRCQQGGLSRHETCPIASMGQRTPNETKMLLCRYHHPSGPVSARPKCLLSREQLDYMLKFAFYVTSLDTVEHICKI